MKVFTPVNQVLTHHLNTPEGNEPINNIQDSEDEEQGVKVLRRFGEGDKNIFKESQGPESEPATQNFNTFGPEKRLINFDDIIF